MGALLQLDGEELQQLRQEYLASRGKVLGGEREVGQKVHGLLMDMAEAFGGE